MQAHIQINWGCADKCAHTLYTQDLNGSEQEHTSILYYSEELCVWITEESAAQLECRSHSENQPTL